MEKLAKQPKQEANHRHDLDYLPERQNMLKNGYDAEKYNQYYQALQANGDKSQNGSESHVNQPGNIQMDVHILNHQIDRQIEKVDVQEYKQ